jgi:hypothetical protein
MIEEFTSGMDFEAFRSSPMAVAAVERKLQIISEAATRLGSEAEQRIPVPCVRPHFTSKDSVDRWDYCCAIGSPVATVIRLGGQNVAWLGHGEKQRPSNLNW